MKMTPKMKATQKITKDKKYFNTTIILPDLFPGLSISYKDCLNKISNLAEVVLST